jgi:hypothetical protein
VDQPHAHVAVFTLGGTIVMTRFGTQAPSFRAG